MIDLALVLAVTFMAGLAVTLARMPALLGFLAAGFLLNAIGVPQPPYLDLVADLGVTLLLFGIGLKLDIRQLFAREVWATTAVHLALTVAISTGFLWVVAILGYPLLTGVDLGVLALIGFAMSFSSTVFVVKVLDEHSELQSMAGRIAVGVLVMQDLAAVVFVTVSGGRVPSLWAIPVLAALVPLAWLARRVWDRIPHGEMRALFGLAMALGPGYAAFDAVGLKGDLGALVVGMLLAGHRAAGELSHTLFQLKDLLIVGFFVSIGFIGVPSLEALGLGLLLLLLLPVQIVLYILLLYWHRLRRRTSVKAGLLLGNYSEFGLIVIAVAVATSSLDESWLVVMSVALAASFVLATLVNERSEAILAVARRILPMRAPDRIHPHERPISFDDARAVVMGMGRIGRSAYEHLSADYGLDVLGVDSLTSRVEELRELGMHIVEGDATDDDFWHRLESTDSVDIVVLAMPFHGANRVALERLHEAQYDGIIAVVAEYADEVDELRALGADVVENLYAGSGASIAELAAEAASAGPPRGNSPDEA